VETNRYPVPFAWCRAEVSVELGHQTLDLALLVVQPLHADESLLVQVLGTLQPGECFSIPIENISGVFATCALATDVDCLIQTSP
jgi:hypothetical protein